MKKYTTKEVSEIFGVSIRTVQRHIATIIEELTNTDKKGFLIPQDVVDLLKQRHLNDTMTTLERHDDDSENEEFPFVEYFTADEYEEFKKYLDKKEQKIKLLVKFDLNDNIDKVLEELNNKEIIF